MTPDATAAVLQLAQATTEADAYALITAAILAGLDGNDAQAALDALPRVLEIMAEELHWPAARTKAEAAAATVFLSSMGLPPGAAPRTTASASASTGSGRTSVRRRIRWSSAISPSRVDSSDPYQSSSSRSDAGGAIIAGS